MVHTPGILTPGGDVVQKRSLQVVPGGRAERHGEGDSSPMSIQEGRPEGGWFLYSKNADANR
ncbi:hypothetical protein [Citrobacter sp. ESBL3]|uniref:hypothetical protein n=1 Tax=Citrobacter sp. ESBL3 TaxID=3077326 RepID=UPI002FCA3135